MKRSAHVSHVSNCFALHVSRFPIFPLVCFLLFLASHLATQGLSNLCSAEVYISHAQRLTCLVAGSQESYVELFAVEAVPFMGIRCDQL